MPTVTMRNWLATGVIHHFEIGQLWLVACDSPSRHVRHIFWKEIACGEKDPSSGTTLKALNFHVKLTVTPCHQPVDVLRIRRTFICFSLHVGLVEAFLPLQDSWQKLILQGTDGKHNEEESGGILRDT